MNLRNALSATAILALLSTGALYVGRWMQTSNPDNAPVRRAPAIPVETTRASAGSLPHTVTAVASLRAVRQVTLAPEVGGRVTDIHFQGGGRITAETAVVDLFSKPQQAELARYRAELTLARLQLQRSIKLNQQNVTSEAEVDSRQAAFDQATAMVAASEAAIEQRTVRAPFSGVLGIRHVDLGQYLNSGDPITTLTDLDELFVDFTVPQQYLGELIVGQAVAVATDAARGQAFTARLETIEPQIDRGTRNVLLRARIANHDLRLRPGLYVSATLTLAPENDVIAVPETAIVASASADTVFIVRDPGADGEGRVEQVSVKTGRRIDGRVAIVSGLEDGDTVVVSGQLRLSRDQKVRVLSGRQVDEAMIALKASH